jgi:hypothetical protein
MINYLEILKTNQDTPIIYLELCSLLDGIHPPLRHHLIIILPKILKYIQPEGSNQV